MDDDDDHPPRERMNVRCQRKGSEGGHRAYAVAARIKRERAAGVRSLRQNISVLGGSDRVICLGADYRGETDHYWGGSHAPTPYYLSVV